MEPKAGWKTSEFWLSLAAVVLGALLAAGLWGPEHVASKLIGAALSVLAALGYTWNRSRLKRTSTKTNGESGQTLPEALWVLAVVALIAFTLTSLGGCTSAARTKVANALDLSSRISHGALIAGVAMCKLVEPTCPPAGNPCPQLDKCKAAQRIVIASSLTAQASATSGLDLLAAGKEEKATDKAKAYLEAAKEAAAKAQRLIDEWVEAVP